MLRSPWSGRQPQKTAHSCQHVGLLLLETVAARAVVELLTRGEQSDAALGQKVSDRAGKLGFSAQDLLESLLLEPPALDVGDGDGACGAGLAREE